MRETGAGTTTAPNEKGAPEGAPRVVRMDREAQFIVGMTKLAPSFTPDGQRAVTVLVLV